MKCNTTIIGPSGQPSQMVLDETLVWTTVSEWVYVLVRLFYNKCISDHTLPLLLILWTNAWKSLMSYLFCLFFTIKHLDMFTMLHFWHLTGNTIRIPYYVIPVIIDKWCLWLFCFYSSCLGDIVFLIGTQLVITFYFGNWSVVKIVKQFHAKM